MAEIDQPTTETALGAPLQKRRDGEEVVVEVRTPDGKEELKRFVDGR